MQIRVIIVCFCINKPTKTNLTIYSQLKLLINFFVIKNIQVKSCIELTAFFWQRCVNSKHLQIIDSAQCVTKKDSYIYNYNS